MRARAGPARGSLSLGLRRLGAFGFLLGPEFFARESILGSESIYWRHLVLLGYEYAVAGWESVSGTRQEILGGYGAGAESAEIS